jgi:Zn-dependent protease with chaperone function
MKSYFGSYYSPSAEPVAATVLVFDRNLSIGYRYPNGRNGMIDWPLKEVEAKYNAPTQQTQLRNTKKPGELLLIEGSEAATYIQAIHAERQKPWYQRSNGREGIRNGLLLLALMGGFVLLYILIVPWLSEKMAGRVAAKTEQKLGDAVYNAMNLQAQEDTAASRVLNQFFKQMAIPSAYDIRISVIKEGVVNAFALPGGRIVVYSALLHKINTYPELAALLSHEFTHVNNKHSTKSIFRKLGSKVFIGLLFGRFGSVASVLIHHADDLKSLKYSRSLEKEADMEGLALLTKRNIDAAGFTGLFTHLKEAVPKGAMPAFLASHPDIDKRIAYIKAASTTAKVETDSSLLSIFNQLK